MFSCVFPLPVAFLASYMAGGGVARYLSPLPFGYMWYLQMQPAQFSLWASTDRQVRRLIAAPQQCWKWPPVVKKNNNWQPFWLVLAPRLSYEIQMPWEPNVPGIQAFRSQQSLGQKANWLLETFLRYLQEKQKGLLLFAHVYAWAEQWWLNR